ncbi:hypothetical protein ON010_g16123 [Phytophthora cinnamomi]|nr:hypothetical protein ON010_g16123 [Phytophthora cinnamomi]
MRGCDNLPADFRRLFSSYERKPYARLSLGLSEAAPEAQAEHPVSPAPSYEPNSASSSPVTPTPFVTRVDVTDVTPAPAVGGLSPPVAENSLLRAEEDPVAESAAASSSGFLTCNSEKMTEILLMHGPCSFMRSAWTGYGAFTAGDGDVTKADLLREVQNLAVEQEISLVTHESNHEGTILDWLLNAKENEIIVLCWVGRLSGSPTILRALELVKNRVIIVSPRGVDHGALPSAVVGVLSGEFCHHNQDARVGGCKSSPTHFLVASCRLRAAVLQLGARCGEKSQCSTTRVSQHEPHFGNSAFFPNAATAAVYEGRTGADADECMLVDRARGSTTSALQLVNPAYATPYWRNVMGDCQLAPRANHASSATAHLQFPEQGLFI